jgi:ankyrin repeat protein
MRRHYPVALLIAFSLLLGGAGGIITPSHHLTDEYNNAFAAASAGDLTTLRKEVDAEPTIVKATEWEGRTLLHDAVDKSQTEVTKYLLDKNCDINAVTTDGRTALHMAAQHGDIPMITLLLARGAKINPVDNKGWTPLDRAEKWGHADAVAFLRGHGAQEGTSAR